MSKKQRAIREVRNAVLNTQAAIKIEEEWLRWYKTPPEDRTVRPPASVLLFSIGWLERALREFCVMAVKEEWI